MRSDRRKSLLDGRRDAGMIALFLLGSLAFACGRPAPTPLDEREPRPPDILLLVVDTLRADHLGAFGSSLGLTPHLDAFAAESIVFTDALAQGSNTINSAPSLLTSRWVAEHGYTNYKRAISKNHLTLAEALQRRGYDTFAVSTNPHVTIQNGLSQGFDTFVDTLIWQDTDASMVDAVFFEWLDGRDSEAPLFAMLWYTDPHEPYRPPQAKIDEVVPAELQHLVGERTSRPVLKNLSEQERRVSRLLYGGEISYYDDQFAGLVAELKRRGLYDAAVIAFTSDHGESFWEHQGVDGRPVVGHGFSLFREETWVPLMIKLPDSSRRGFVTERVSSIDLAPTLSVLAGAGVDDQFRGRDLGPFFETDRRTPAPAAPRFSELLTDHQGEVQLHKESVQTDDGKLVRTYVYRRKTYDPPIEWLFDGADVPISPDSADGRAARDRLREALEQWRSDLEPLPTRSVPPHPGNEELAKRLKSLGYL